MSRILIGYASTYGQTRKISDALATELRRAGHEVELADAMAAMPPPVEDYDVVVLGSRVQFGVHAQPILDYIAENRTELTEIPSYLFSVSMSAAGDPAADPQGYLEKLFAQTHWRPRAAIAFAGALHYRRYGFFLRMVMKLISRRAGHATDTRIDHEYTDWLAVKRFAADIARDLAPLPITARPSPRAQA
jgi:menaquinone-dependent protoporphyrinogen oxidase